jgi:tRNA threonylcarbamoyl adenosine modification protein YeaZ
LTGGLDAAADGFVLALEGSTEVASCAIRAPGGLVTELATPAGRRHVEGLPALVGEAAARAGVLLRELALVVVGSGPGSYMGIRATVAVANSLSYVGRCPIAEISTLDSLGLELAGQERASLVAIAAGRGRFFVAAYRLLDGVVERVQEPELVEGDQIGDGADAAVYGLDGSHHPTARGHLAAIGKRPDWLNVRAVAGAQPRYGPSRREA